MWIEDLTKALYFLNATDYKNSVCITRIENNVIHFSNGRCVPLKILIEQYDTYIRTGKTVALW